MLTGEIARRDVACILLLTALECMLHGGSMATAAPLQKEACDLLIEEQAKLDTAGVKDWLKAGPAAQDTSLAGSSQRKALAKASIPSK